MRTARGALVLFTLLAAIAAAGSIAFAAPRSNFAVVGVRVPARVRLSDVH